MNYIKGSYAKEIYSNKDNLENCFRSFLPKAALYDAVVCVNGYAAVSLVKKLEKENAANGVTTDDIDISTMQTDDLVKQLNDDDYTNG